MEVEPTYHELKSVRIREAINGYTVERYGRYGEMVEVAKSWDEAIKLANKLMTMKDRKKK